MASHIPKHFWLFLFFSILLGFYTLFFSQYQYTVIVDGKVVNFTGVEDFIPPFVSYYPVLFAVPQNKLLSCGIPKSMSQLMINIMCLLYDEESFLKSNSLNDTWITKRKCQEQKEFRQPSPSLKTDNGTVRFAFVRDPIQRFVSLYLDKCIHTKFCFDCGTNMRCFVERIYETLRRVKNNRHDPFQEPDVMAQHAAPLSWMCNFDRDIEKWHLLMMGSDFNERKSSTLHLANILRQQGFDNKLVDKIHQETLAGETAHSTHKSSYRIEAERQVREDPFIRDMLHKIYFFDYLVFPFKRDHLDVKYQTNYWNAPDAWKFSWKENNR